MDGMGAPERTAVDVVVPAASAAAHILRTTAVSLASSQLDLDRLDDLALAVAETTVELLALEGATLLAMTIDRDGHGLDMALFAEGPTRPDWKDRWERSLSAQVLSVLAEEVTAEAGADGRGVRFRFQA